MLQTLAFTLNVTFFALMGFVTAHAQQGEPSSGPSITNGSQPNYSDPYQDSNGHYRDLGDFTRDINGVPCGIDCSKRVQERNLNRQ